MSRCRSNARVSTWLLRALLLSAPGIALANDHLHPQPRPPQSVQRLSADGKTTYVATAQGIFPKSNPFADPPGTNLLPTIYANMFDGKGAVMPNTLPSTPEHPYNLHDDPIVTDINPTSPNDDLRRILKELRKQLDGAAAADVSTEPSTDSRRYDAQLGLDILEGNPVRDRAYSGLPLLHYKGPENVKKVGPIYDSGGHLIGGNVNIHQIWFDGRIESDTMFLDTSSVAEVPWTITYVIDVLNRGADDFAPFAIYFDDPTLSPPGRPLPHIAMDQTFFPIEDGTRSIFKIRMTLGKYFNMTYHWGWRRHSPRIQVTDNALKVIDGKKLPQWEIDVFGPTPSASRAEQLRAIAMIGDLAPEKRLWRAFMALRDGSQTQARNLLDEAERAFEQSLDRLHLPDGVKEDQGSDLTLLYVNDTIYGHVKGIEDDSKVTLPKWVLRGTKVKIKLYNGDYFLHGYINADFGGLRGWENTFQSTQAIGGDGFLFTFGRANWWINAGNPEVGLITVPPATRSGRGGVVGEHNVEITYNYEPSRRLRFYQFDPLHHNVAIFSVH